MENSPVRIRKPVRREGAERYLLLTLLSFAVSVSLTRLFLFLTGYPQIGGGELHIAHVVWGGLLLYVAGLFPLLYANRWAFNVSGILSGIGIGLFIDEVGKFITQTNDYFYPPAAPIIYAFFLLSVLLYQRIRTRSSLDVRSQLYCVMDGMDEVLDHDLSDHERADLLQRLDTIIRQTPARDLAELARSLKEFIGHEQLHVIPHQPGTLERLQTRYKAWEARWLTRRRFQAILAGGVIAVAVWMMYYPMAIVLSINTPGVASPILTELIQKGLIRGYTALNWYEARVALEISVGVILLIGAGLLFGGKDKRGSALIYLGLLLSLTTVNLIVFYFDQFSTIFNATIQFIFLLIVIYYRNAFMIPKEQDI